jgi:hypothetical protein
LQFFSLKLQSRLVLECVNTLPKGSYGISNWGKFFFDRVTEIRVCAASASEKNGAAGASLDGLVHQQSAFAALSRKID